MTTATHWDSIESRLQRAMQAQRKGDRSLANNILKTLAREHPRDGRVWLALALVTEHFQSRLLYLELALAISPYNPLLQQIVEAMWPPAPGVELNEEFRRALLLMNFTRDCIFVTGKAGTGKSTLLRYFKENTDKRTVVLAYTGLAAVNVQGQTIHSFFRFPRRIITKKDIREIPNGLYQHLETIVIDEVSMLRADIMDAIDHFLRLNGPDPGKPFGGVQIIFFGDPFQLEPIVSDPEEAKCLADMYRSPWFFDSDVFNEVFGSSKSHKVVILDKPYRHADPNFLELLDAVRVGEIEDTHLSLINSRYNPTFEIDEKFRGVYLTTKRTTAEQLNQERLAKLRGRAFTYEGSIFGEFPRRLPTDMRLALKEGAQVMFVRNDKQQRWTNGTLGTVCRLTDNSIEVEIRSDGCSHRYEVEREEWQIIR